VPASHVEPISQGDYRLTQDNGPWLIMAESFEGPGAEEQARQLAEELQQRHGLSARKALDQWCLTVLNLSEFIYLD
jgi:hypothetical protein